MRRLYDWFWALMDEQETHHGQRVVAGFFGMVVLVTGLLFLWFLGWLCDTMGWQ